MTMTPSGAHPPRWWTAPTAGGTHVPRHLGLSDEQLRLPQVGVGPPLGTKLLRLTAGLISCACGAAHSFIQAAITPADWNPSSWADAVRLAAPIAHRVGPGVGTMPGERVGGHRADTAS